MKSGKEGREERAIKNELKRKEEIQAETKPISYL